MGISGLLPLLKKASKNCHLSKLKGSTAAIDGHSWLHKGSFGCAEKLGKGEPTNAYITYFMKYINLLKKNGITPVVVFDGRSLPSKAETDRKRREKREENKKRAMDYLRKGRRKEAWECFTRCVEITQEMVLEVVKVLRQEGVDYIIAPYEADAQLAYLAINGFVDFVITEDSDLTLFECPKIFFKLKSEGHGVLYEKSKLHLCFEQTKAKFNFQQFRRMCILSGCDYLPSLPGIGLTRAKKVFIGTIRDDLHEALKRIPSTLGLDIEVSDEYIGGFIQAEKTFMFQLIFDPSSRTLKPLNPYPADVVPESLHYAGKYEDNELACEMAIGNFNVKRLVRVDNFTLKSNEKFRSKQSIWNKNIKVESGFSKIEEELSINVEESSIVSEDFEKVKKPEFDTQEFTVAFNSFTRKRSIDDIDSEVENESLIALYKSAKQQITGEIGDEDKKTTVVSQATSGRNIEKSIKNPFKSLRTLAYCQSKNNLAESKYPICSVVKNKVYIDDEELDEDKIIVKSHYFRFENERNGLQESKILFESCLKVDSDVKPDSKELKSSPFYSLSDSLSSSGIENKDESLNISPSSNKSLIENMEIDSEEVHVFKDDPELTKDNLVRRSPRISLSKFMFTPLTPNSARSGNTVEKVAKKTELSRTSKALTCKVQGLSRKSRGKKTNNAGVSGKQRSIKTMLSKT